MSAASRDIALILRLIDEAFDHRAWHGTNLKGSLRGLGVREAAWRPSPKRHNAWEIVAHCAYWKYAVRRRLTGEKRGSFLLEGSNWFERPVAGEKLEKLWRADVELLVTQHRALREAIEHISVRALGSKVGKTRMDSLLLGVAAHDLYHAGQIQLLKRLRGGD